MMDNDLTQSIPGETGPAVIRMKGEATPISTFTRIHEIRDGIKVQKKEVSKPGAVKHFRSTGGRSALKAIAAEQKAVVEVYTVEEEYKETNKVTGSLYCKICHGTTDDGRMVYGTCHNKVSAELPYERPLPFIQYDRARTCQTPVPVLVECPFV